MKMSQIRCTGASLFLGSHVSESLASQNHEVVGTVRSSKLITQSLPVTN